MKLNRKRKTEGNHENISGSNKKDCNWQKFSVNWRKKFKSRSYFRGFGRWKSTRNGRVAGFRSVANLEINIRRDFRPEKIWRIINACQTWAFFVSPPTSEQCRLQRSNDDWTIVEFFGSRRPGGRKAKSARGQLLQRYEQKGRRFHEFHSREKNRHGGSISTRMVHEIFKILGP